MKKLIKYTLAAAALIASTSAAAQNLESAYFLDGYSYGHHMNPARDYDRKGYVGFPLLGNLNIGTSGNFGLKSFFFPNPNGKGVVTFLHPDISTSTALSGFKDRNMMIADLNLDLISFGFHTKHFYNTFDLRLRSETGLMIPGDLMRMVRELKNKDYSFQNLGMRTNEWIEAAFGTSRDVIDGVRVGGKFKFLVGGAYADVKMDDLSMNLAGTDKWTVSASAHAEIGLKGFEWGQKKDGGEIDMSNVNVKNPGIGGLGAAFDLGGEVDFGKLNLVPGLKAGLAVVDLGFIKWNNVATALASGDSVEFYGFNNIKVKGGEGEDIEDLANDRGDRFEDLIKLQDSGLGSKTRMLGATLNISAEYALPMYDRLRFGFLSTTRIQGAYTWNEERFAATCSPLKWLEASVNLGVGTFGTSFGWVVNIHPRGFNLFLGMDHVMGKLAKQGIPLKTNGDITLGITFPFGKSRVGKDKADKEI